MQVRKEREREIEKIERRELELWAAASFSGDDIAIQ